MKGDFIESKCVKSANPCLTYFQAVWILSEAKKQICQGYVPLAFSVVTHRSKMLVKKNF